MGKRVDPELFGVKRAENLCNKLDPKDLKGELEEYQKILGKEFGIDDLLKIYDIRARALMAGCILDAPEILVHELTIQEEVGAGCAKALYSVSEAIENLSDR